jgi:hypothetical protein
MQLAASTFNVRLIYHRRHDAASSGSDLKTCMPSSASAHHDYPSPALQIVIDTAALTGAAGIVLSKDTGAATAELFAKYWHTVRQPGTEPAGSKQPQ